MQQELFKELQTEGQAPSKRVVLFPHRFLRIRVAYEDAIFSGLALVLALLAGFCLGVERGKALRGNLPASQGSAPQSVAEELAAQSLPLSSPGLPSSPLPAVKAQGQGFYAIQLASYLDAGSAEREAGRLKRQGYEAQILKSGRYYELRVSGFLSREQAASSLATLRKTYRDGFVKRVSS